MRLFVYGVLLGEIARGTARDLVRGLDRGFTATVPGALYVVEDEAGAYPALVPDPRGDPVHGLVHDIGPREMAAIDIFERADEDYERRSLPVTAPDGTQLAAGVYCWRGSVEGLERIAHGDFARWLTETGRTPFSA